MKSSLSWNSLIILQCLIAVTLALSIPKSGGEDDFRPSGSPKIAGGVNAECQEFPWMASVYAYDIVLLTYPCGGSVINSRCILTLDTCLSILGVNNISDTDSPGRESLVSAEFFFYPNRDELNFVPAVIVLPSTITFSEYVQPIHLYDSRKDELSDFAFDPVVLAGWGHISDLSIKYSETLRKVNTTVITNEECQRSFTSTSIPINENVICTSGARGVGACPGDIGIPVNYYDATNNRWMQIGIMAFGGSEGCQTGFPNGAYRLGSPDTIDWIESICGPLPV